MTTSAGSWTLQAVLRSVLVLAVVQADGLEALREHSAVYRSWSVWAAWSQCSRTCGGGVSMRTRVCRTRVGYGMDGFPQQCVGETTEYVLCRTEICPPYTTDFRAHQCALHNGHQVAGRVVHQWVPSLGGPNPCELVCRAGHLNFQYTFGKARDGTSCRDGGICVNGRCTTVSCDGKIGGSTVQTDVCGVCGGNNATCVHIVKTYRGQLPRSRNPLDRSYDYHQVAVIPAGSTLVKVTDSSASYLALMDSRGAFMVNGNWRVEQPGVYPAAGALASYTRTWNNRESLAIPGPTFEDLIVLVLGTGTPPEVHYEYWLPRDRLPTASWKGPVTRPGATPHGPRPQRPEVLDVGYYGYLSVTRASDPWTMYTVSQYLADGNSFRSSKSQDKGTLAIERKDGTEPFLDRRKVLARERVHSRDKINATPKVVSGGLLRNHVPARHPQLTLKDSAGMQSKSGRRGTEHPRRKGSCPPCPRVKQQAKHFCTSDFVLRVVVMGREPVFNQTRLELQVVQSYKNNVHILPREYLWTGGGCPCPRLRRGREYIVMGRAVRTGSRNESHLTVDRDSYIRPYSQKRSRAVMKLRRDQDRLCRRRTS